LRQRVPLVAIFRRQALDDESALSLERLLLLHNEKVTIYTFRFNYYNFFCLYQIAGESLVTESLQSAWLIALFAVGISHLFLLEY
jgi:hypothetical protein